MYSSLPTPMKVNPIDQLSVYGPGKCQSLPGGVDEARNWCRRLAHGRYENFSVLSALVPHDLRDDFAAVYAFCRWADDLGDEVGDTNRSLELLAWWRSELQLCFEGRPRHPVFLALQPTIEKHDLPIEPFDALIRAFEQDQSVTRYETWRQVLDYCTRSADPVGRLVLMVCGERRDDETFALSDKICTALQLTNHWQDVKRDILERDRIYIPREFYDPHKCNDPHVAPRISSDEAIFAESAAAVGAGRACSPNGLAETACAVHEDSPDQGDSAATTATARTLPPIANFEARLIASARQGWAVDREFLPAARRVIRECVDRTWPLFEEGSQLLRLIQPQTRPIIWLFAAGGQHVLRSIEMWNYETALHRPKLTKPRKALLVARAWLQSRFSGRSR